MILLVPGARTRSGKISAPMRSVVLSVSVRPVDRGCEVGEGEGGGPTHLDAVPAERPPGAGEVDRDNGACGCVRGARKKAHSPVHDQLPHPSSEI